MNIRIELNLNDLIEVKLTDYGKDILLKHKHWNDYPEYYRRCFKGGKDGYYQFQFGDFLNIYGSRLNDGQPYQCIAGNIILIETK